MKPPLVIVAAALPRKLNARLREAITEEGWTADEILAEALEIWLDAREEWEGEPRLTLIRGPRILHLT